jgi:hypothetical protein
VRSIETGERPCLGDAELDRPVGIGDKHGRWGRGLQRGGDQAGGMAQPGDFTENLVEVLGWSANASPDVVDGAKVRLSTLLL